MAISVRPTVPAVDTGAALCPDHLYLFTEGAGAVAFDVGKAVTKQDFSFAFATAGAPAWITDPTHGPALSFVQGDGDTLGVVSDMGVTTSFTMFVLAYMVANPSQNVALIGFGDPAITTRFYTGAIDGSSRLSQQYRDGAAHSLQSFNNAATGLADSAFHLWAWTYNDTAAGMTCGRSNDGEAFVNNDEVNAAVNLTLASTRFGLGGRLDSTPSTHSTFVTIGCGLYTRVLTNLEIANLYNGGNVWPSLGVSEFSAPPPSAAGIQSRLNRGLN